MLLERINICPMYIPREYSTLGIVIFVVRKSTHEPTVCVFKLQYRQATSAEKSVTKAFAT